MSDGDDVVKLTDADNEAEAAVIVGYLESCGIQATYDRGGTIGPPLGFMAGQTGFGPQQILVRAEDLERAQKALDEREPI
jgi:hypothetical protein